MDNIWMHLLVLIPIEFGILHATPLGGMLVAGFQEVFASVGLEFAQAAAGHGCGIAGCSLDHAFWDAASSGLLTEAIPPALPSFSLGEGALTPS